MANDALVNGPIPADFEERCRLIARVHWYVCTLSTDDLGSLSCDLENRAMGSSKPPLFYQSPLVKNACPADTLNGWVVPT